MDLDRGDLIRNARRAVLSVACLGTGFLLLSYAATQFADESLKLGMAVSVALFGFGALLAGAVIIASSISEGVASLWARLIYPEAERSEASSIYDPAESLVDEGKLEEAIEAYKAIAKDRPKAVHPYVRMIEIAAYLLNDPRRANALYQRGMAMLRDKRAKRRLTALYEFTRGES